MEHRQPSKTTQVLHVSYLPPSAGFVLPVITRIQNSPKPALSRRMAEWREGPLTGLGLAMSTKLSMLPLVAERLMRSRNEILMASPRGDDLEEHLARGAGWNPVPNRSLPYQVLVDIDSFIFEFRSAYEILGKFLVSFFEDILGRKVTEKEIIEHLKSQGIDMGWAEELRSHRKVFFHNDAPWLAISIGEPMPEDRDLLILIGIDPDVTDPDKCLTFSRLQAIYGGMDAALRAIQDWMLREVSALEAKL